MRARDALEKSMLIDTCVKQRTDLSEERMVAMSHLYK